MYIRICRLAGPYLWCNCLKSFILSSAQVLNSLPFVHIYVSLSFFFSLSLSLGACLCEWVSGLVDEDPHRGRSLWNVHTSCHIQKDIIIERKNLGQVACSAFACWCCCCCRWWWWILHTMHRGFSVYLERDALRPKGCPLYFIHTNNVANHAQQHLTLARSSPGHSHSRPPIHPHLEI